MSDKVSVIIPTYNREKYIFEALYSVYSQTYRPLEVIVVDDGSTDETEKVVMEWAKDHDEPGFFVDYFYQNNQGAPTARNRGLEIARGEYIKFLDSDDILHEDCISRQVIFSKQLKMNQIVFGDLGSFDLEWSFKREYYSPPKEEDSFEYLIKNIVNTPTPLHRRDLLLKVEGFREGIEKGQEYDLHLRLAMLGVEFKYQKGVVAFKRILDGESNLTTINKVENNPEAHIFVHDNKVQLACKYYNKKIPKNIQKKLARGYWMVGRQLARAGYSQRAIYCFKQSKDLAVDNGSHIQGPMPYKWITKICNPILAEHIFTILKKSIGR